ncbi:MAG: 2'-5' RNA ligase [Flammeovirgaceae bacterium]|nr:2'-5' RNA ligase [Flammeovirgaceae bacterium]|tara:strand:+ start:7510 stop:8610 length:1101 start_codon:yes stop_codon:yes gene_type:complete
MKMTFPHVDLLNEMVDGGYVKKQKHPSNNWFLYGYTPKAVYDGEWNEVTRAARGLILDPHGSIIALPIPKFFNLHEEADIPLPDEEFTVYEKMDGSLGIMFYANRQWHVATRGSFTSEQAVRAKSILMNKYPHHESKLNRYRTYCVEIIYPSNRIVVDYGDMEDLVFLVAYGNSTGEEFLPGEIETPFPQVETRTIKGWEFSKYDISRLPEYMQYDNGLEHEGFVVRFESGYRVKVKIDDYVKLHRVLTNTSNISVWKVCSEGGNTDDIINEFPSLPATFKVWLLDTETKLRRQYAFYLRNAQKLYKWQGDFKSTALWIQEVSEGDEPILKSLLFAIMREKDPSPMIWKHIRDHMEHEKPYVVEGE